MVRFDSREPGTPARTWTDDERFGTLPQLLLDGVREVIVVAAHPDDESLGAGGLMAECHARGIPVRVLMVTDGGGSHPSSPTRPPSELATRRRAEARRALEAVAPGSPLRFLDVQDGAVRESREAVRERLRSLIGTPVPGGALVAPWRGDGHRDHRVVGEVCADLAAELSLLLLEYPIWMWHWSTPDDPTTPWTRLHALPLSTASVAAKRRAVNAHESQVDALSRAVGDEAALLPSFLSHFDRALEVFICAAQTDPPRSTLPSSYFDATYERHTDPWGFDTRWYERRKRAITIASLPLERFGYAFEVGCSIGVLTSDLAERCDDLLSVDISSAAVERARERLAGRAGVRIERFDVGSGYPPGEFDLVVLSEVGYYFDEPSLARLLAAVERSLSPAGVLVLCHWRHPVRDYPLAGDTVHAMAERRLSLTRLAAHVEEDFLLDVYGSDPRSVAELTGLLE